MHQHDQPLATLIDWQRVPMPAGRRVHRRRFDLATDVQVLIRADTPITQTGVGIGCYTPVPRRDPADCRHIDTICRSCRHEWQQDYFLGVFTHGTGCAYRNQGCRCTPCRTAATREAASRTRQPAAATGRT